MRETTGAPSIGAPASPDGELQWRFCSHVLVARTTARVFLLDLRADKYFAVGREAMGEPGFAGANERALEKLRGLGLVEQRRTDRRLGETENPEVAMPAPGAGVFAFLNACLWARHIVSKRDLCRAIATMDGWRRRHEASDLRPEPIVERFQALRPWYPRRSVCLFDALALAHLLAAARVRADFVFGVRGMPFAAHCWIECGGCVQNDDPAYCNSFVRMVRE